MSKKRHLEYNPRLSYHYSQIPTTKRDIRKQLWEFDMKLPTLVIQCILHKDKADYYRFLLHAATTIEFLSRLVYWSKTGKQYKKPPAAYYKENLFEGHAETPEEVENCAKRVNESITDAVQVHKILWQIADVVCEMMATSYEHSFMRYYAYAIDYIIHHSEGLPKPDMRSWGPINYENYNPFDYEIPFLLGLF